MNILKYIPENGVCKQLFIVGPYPMDTYIKEICKGLKVQKKNFEIIVYADESWNEDIVEKIKQIENTKVILVKGKNGDGLVHAKMYFLNCEKRDGRSSCTLITGSANASKSGMTKNAEVLTVTKLAQFEPESQQAIKLYFSSFLEDGNEEVEGVIAKFKNSIGPSSILLPALKKSNKTISFYSWLRSGYLFYKYEKDQNFGYIVINLEKPLPGDKNITSLIKKSIFKNDAELHSLRYQYLKLEKIKEKRLYPSNYALQSDYGYWISRDCFKDKKNFIFQENTSSDLLECVEVKKRNQKKIIEKVKKSIEKLMNNPSIQRCIGSRINDLDSIVVNKINRDHRMSMDENFVFRYKTGYAQHKMPNFDENDFNEFLDSAMGSCLIKLNGNSVKNLFVKKLRTLLEEYSKDFDDPKELSSWLDKKWSCLYERLRFYYKNDITFVHQYYESDSGIACVAMLSEKSYKSVMKNAGNCFSRMWGRNENYGMNNIQIKKLIKKVVPKCDCDIGKFKPFNTWDDIKSRCLVSVDFNEESNTCHWIIADRVDNDLIVYDPREYEPIKNPEQELYENIYQYLPISF